MPKELEAKLRRQVAGKRWSKEQKDAYVYGTMRKKTGWEQGNQNIRRKAVEIMLKKRKRKSKA